MKIPREKKQFLKYLVSSLLLPIHKLRKHILINKNIYTFFYNSLEIEKVANVRNYFVFHSSSLNLRNYG